jgi:phosphate acetyltransferase
VASLARKIADVSRLQLVFLSVTWLAGIYVNGFVPILPGTGTEAILLNPAVESHVVLATLSAATSVFILALQDRAQGHNGLMAFADCAVVTEPSAIQMADIAIAAAESTRVLIETEPVVALLSYSTKGSGKGRTVDKVVEAVEILRARAPELNADGELQADAAVDLIVGRIKAPGSKVAGHANTLVFPSLESANIAYKLVERLGGAMAIGPFLQGLAKPANDLSRGCSAEDIFNVAVVTALQSEPD